MNELSAIFFAAGIGSRITKNIDGKPKCTLPINGTPLINDSIDKLRNIGVKDITVVTGYEREVLCEILDPDVKTIHNPFYKNSNSVVSLWLAKEILKTSTNKILLNADVYFDRELLECINLNSSSAEPVLLADSTRKVEGDYFFGWNQSNRLLSYGKNLTIDERNGEYVGIGIMSANYCRNILYSNVCNHIDNELINDWWEDTIYKTVTETNVQVRDVSGIFWAEVDFFEDYQRICKHVQKNR